MSATEAPIAGPGMTGPGHNRNGYADTRAEFGELVGALQRLPYWCALACEIALGCRCPGLAHEIGE